MDCRAYAVRRLVVVVLPLFDFLQQRTTWGGEKRSSSRIRNKSTDIRLRCAGNNHFVDCLFGLFVVCAFELREQRPKLDSLPCLYSQQPKSRRCDTYKRCSVLVGTKSNISVKPWFWSNDCVLFWSFRQCKLRFWVVIPLSLKLIADVTLFLNNAASGIVRATSDAWYRRQQWTQNGAAHTLPAASVDWGCELNPVAHFLVQGTKGRSFRTRLLQRHEACSSNMPNHIARKC